jgi:hypothetical protein
MPELASYYYLLKESMNILKCKICKGEVEIISNDKNIQKKVKCLKCGFTNGTEKKSAEVVIIRRPFRKV